MPVVDAKVIIVWATPAGANVNTLEARFDDAAISYQGVADSFRDNLTNSVMSQMANTVSLTEVKVGDDILGAVSPGASAGALSQGNSNPSICFAVTKVTASGRNGRFFWPGVTEPGTQDNGELIPGTRIAVQTQFDSFLSLMEADGVDMRIQQKSPAPSVQIDSFSVRPFASLQKRRYNRLRS